MLNVFHPQIVTLFDEAMKSTLLDSFFIEKMLYYPIFGNGDTNEWPTELGKFVLERRKRTPKKRFLEKNQLTDLTRLEQQIHFFGAVVFANGAEAKEGTTNFLYPHFIREEKLKSGETPTALLQAIRKSQHDNEALR